ncbi:MAG: DUF5372 family protein [Solirubrobacteraceae bacterium]
MTHPFHPLLGQRLEVLFERRCPAGRLYVCAGGRMGSIGIPEDSTDRAPARAATPLTSEVLAGLVGVVAAIKSCPSGEGLVGLCTNQVQADDCGC